MADAGRDEDAIKYCEMVPDFPENPNRELCIRGAQVRLGKAREVVQFYEANKAKLVVRALGAVGCAYARLGRRDDAEHLVGESNSDTGGAEILSCLGSKDGVFAALDRNSVVGPIRMGYFLLRVDRENRGLLRGDPRLKALRMKVGLPE
jgi:hypothetical protein